MGRISLASSAVRERLTQLADVTVSKPHTPPSLERERERERDIQQMGTKSERHQSDKEYE